MANQIIEAIEKALAEAQVKLQAAAAPDAVEAVRIELIGRKGLLPALSKQMGSVPPEERGATGKAFNSAREQLQNMIDEALTRLSNVADASGSNCTCGNDEKGFEGSGSECHAGGMSEPRPGPTAVGRIHLPPKQHLKRCCFFFALLEKRWVLRLKSSNN